MTVADLAIIAGLVFAWGTLSARLERFDVTAPIVFTVAGVLLTHGLLAPLEITPGSEVVKVLTEATLALVLSPTRPGSRCISCGATWGCAYGCSASGCRWPSAWARWRRSSCPG